MVECIPAVMLAMLRSEEELRMTAVHLPIMLLDNGTLGIQCEDFKLACEGVEEQCKEHQSATIVETRGIWFHIKEHCPKDDGHDQVHDQLRDGELRIGDEASPATPEN